MKDLKTKEQEFRQTLDQKTTKSFMVSKNPNGLPSLNINTHLMGEMKWSVGILTTSSVVLTRLELKELRDEINEFLDNN